MVPAVACRLVSDSSSNRPSIMPDMMIGRSPARFDVAGIGNALVDVIASSTEEFLVEHGLVKGSMTLVEIDRATELYGALGTAVEMSGGSAANTMCGLASFGGRAAYIGKVDTDDLGEVFGHDMRAVGVTFRGGGVDARHADRAVRHRRHARCRAHDEHLSRGVEPARRPTTSTRRSIADSSVLYMEGYLFDRDDGQGGIPARRRGRPRARPHRVADPVRLVLRRAPS